MKFILGLLFSALFFQSFAVNPDLEKRIRKIFPTAELTVGETKDHFASQYTIMIDQFIDHNDRSKGTFKQRLFLSHYDRKAPIVLVTEGYGARPVKYELSEILMSNQLIVEYRFFGESVPKEMDYQYLTNQQAMEDLHRITKAFKKIYRKEWISTGISKGGTTCMYYKATYPKDVKVAVPYVGPLPAAREDKRTDNLILSVGQKACRQKLQDFQLAALTLQDEILPMARKKAEANSLTFDRIEGVEKAIEYAILEYTFSFWQMGYDCESIPVNPSAEEAFDNLMDVVGIDFYSDAVIKYYEPAFYQFMTQNGYYGFINEPLQSKLKHVKRFDNEIFAPRGVSLDYDPSYNQEIIKRLDKKGKRMLIIQGEYDPWGALTYKPALHLNSLLMVRKGGSHKTRISDFEEEERQLMYDFMDKWLKAPVVNRL